MAAAEGKSAPNPVRISVIVVNWNRRELLAACLQSLARQTHPDFEVVVIDNGSGDGSAEAVLKIAETYPVGLKLIQNSTNRGFCAANNQGIAATRSPLVVLLNNDAEAEPGWLTALESVIESDAAVGMAASKILVFEDPRRIDKVGHLMYPDGQNRGRGSGQLDHGQFDRVDETLWPDGCAAMYRRAMLDEVGGFDEDFFAYADDAELGLRGRIAGWICLYAPGAVVRHHRGATLGLSSARRLALIERNRVLLAVKLFPWNLLWLNGAYYRNKNRGRDVGGAPQPGGNPSLFGDDGANSRRQRRCFGGPCRRSLLIPRMLRKRWAFRPKRRLSASQIRGLLLRHRISLKEISESAT